ncbi:hypothetical protein PoB_000802000 [Plakobranchus ocellatus]|uniref:Secreted protein n=1 Tax=Plakobranchus ocellatus TaxID=259542 RepID=A0AAV3YEN2_9GAST|nr:hypothetical protein PoB_000802000 [Plakobranchus ocellatus]
MQPQRIVSLSLPLLAVMLIISVSCNSGQILNRGTCMATRSLFKSNGCVKNQEKLVCKVLGFTLKFQVAGVPLCKYFPCVGYNQPPTFQCRRLILGGCRLRNIDLNGICSGTGELIHSSNSHLPVGQHNE